MCISNYRLSKSSIIHIALFRFLVIQYTSNVFLCKKDGGAPTQDDLDQAQREIEECNRLEWEKAVPMGGNPQDVFGFNLMLSIGDIAKDDFANRRQKTIGLLWRIYPEDLSDTLLDITVELQKSLNCIRERAVCGEDIRIWYSNQSDELCGFYWFMAELRPFCAAHWNALQEENAPLRAVLNGRLLSMPESIYDHFILQEILAENDEFQEAMIVGRALGKYRLGIGDAWIAHRIEKMIDDGKLTIASAPEKDRPVYHRKLKKSK